MAKDKLLAEWFWTDRWMGSSGFLLPLEPRGLYREMLTQAWRRGGRLPNDHAAIQRATGVSAEEWVRCWPSVAAYWRVDGDSLVNDTQVEVYTEARAAQERATERGRRGAQATAQVRAQASAQAPRKRVLKHQPPSPSPSPSPSLTPDNGNDSGTAAPAGVVLTPEVVKAPSWSAEACDDWQAHLGTPPGGRIGNALKPLVKAHGWELVRPLWREACERAASEPDPTFFTPEVFARTFKARLTSPATARGKPGVSERNAEHLRTWIDSKERA
jgi:uncharacterized protein YdaU (DUF1376 family)